MAIDPERDAILGRGLERREVRLGDGRRAAYLERGTGPPVILVHGLGLSADVWRGHLVGLGEAGYRAIAPDLAGFGRSDGPRSGSSVPATADWLERFWRVLRLPPALWVGHSVAVQPLIRLAVRPANSVAGLVLAAPTGRSGPHLLHQLLGLARTAPRERPSLVLHVVRHYLTAALPALGTWLRARHHDALPDAAGVTVPALVVLGGRDPVVPASYGARLAGVLPRGRVTWIEGAAHAVALDPYAPFMEALLEFLDRVYSERTSERWKSSGIARKSQGEPGS